MSKKILIVDDSATIRQQLSRVLAEAGFVVVEAADGLEAMDRLAAHADVAAVICDVNMPRMNGLEFVEKVRLQSDKERLPLVMLTTEGQPGLIHRAKQLGANAWIIKPFKPTLLLAAVSALAA
jgi:two-component system, chemotaxis family, chemotaxis protein CheY